MRKAPEDYHLRAMATYTIETGSVVYRCHHKNNNPDFFAIDGKPHQHVYSGRFGDNNKSEGVCYLGTSSQAAMAETLLQENMRYKAIAKQRLNQTCMSIAIIERDLKLVEFKGNGLHKNFIDSNVPSGPHVVSRSYSTAIIKNKGNYDGIIWRSRINDDYINIALFERARDSLHSWTLFGSLDGPILKNDTNKFLSSHSIGKC